MLNLVDMNTWIVHAILLFFQTFVYFYSSFNLWFHILLFSKKEQNKSQLMTGIKY